MRKPVKKALLFLGALAMACSSVSGPSVMEEVEYTEGGVNVPYRTFRSDAEGNFVSECECPRGAVEGRLEPSERVRMQIAVDSASFRDLAPSYPSDPWLMCVTEPHYIIRVTRGDGVQEVRATGCAEHHPAALDAALGVSSDVLDRIYRAN